MAENRSAKEILLVDDDPDYSEVTRTRLEAFGYQVSCVSNGEQALEFLDRDRQPSLIIMDVDMPDKNGLTTLININARRSRQSEKEKPSIPVIVATGLEGEKIRELIMNQNVSRFLKKPYDSKELIQAVKRLIG